ncbi:transposase family protein [Streptosporangiaceae bacterium NEAU-GS5]|nr:transposase family protein [Streptosporangiaceae bacterium NEAU-GS5]
MLSKGYLLDDEVFLAELRGGRVSDHDDFPVLLALSDNGPQMTSAATRVFMAGARIAQHFGRPGTPNDQAWIESLFGHVKDEFPHLDKIADPVHAGGRTGRHPHVLQRGQAARGHRVRHARR